MPRTPPLDEVRRSAVLSADGRCRHRLDRWWGPGSRVVFTMLNPSLADAERDDATAVRVMRFARAWGFDGVTVVNVHPFRTPSVPVLRAWLRVAPWEEERARNLDACRAAWAEAPYVVAAWGRHAGSDGPRTLALLREAGVDVRALALNLDGSPRHPLYVRGDATPRPLDEVRGGWGKVEHQL